MVSAGSFLAVVGHGWLADRNDIRSTKTCATFSERFHTGTTGERKLWGNWLPQVHVGTEVGNI